MEHLPLFESFKATGMAGLAQIVEAIRTQDYFWLSFYFLIISASIAFVIFGLMGAYRAAFPKAPKPKLIPSIDEPIVGQFDQKSAITLYVSVANIGSAPSIAETYNLAITKKDGTGTEKLRPFIFLGTTTLTNEGHSTKLNSSDYIFNKTFPTPIQPGEKIRGHLHFVTETPIDDLLNTPIVLSIQGISGKVIQSKPSRFGGTKTAPFSYHAGMNLPKS